MTPRAHRPPRGAAILLVAAVLLPGCDCGSSGAPDPCAGIDCGEFGDCRVAPDGSTPYCACDPGYRPDGTAGGCVPVDPDDPCSGVECSGHGGCRVAIDGTTPYCTCDPGWVVDETRLHCLPDPSTPPDAGDDGGGVPDDGGTGPDDGGTGPDDGGTVSPRVVPVTGPAINRVDIVMVVDNSVSMVQEQAALTTHFPVLIRDLVDPPDRDHDGVPDHPAVEDLRIGIVSTDMGTMGLAVPTCANSVRGDNGCLRHAGSPEIPGCRPTYPAWLTRDPSNAATYAPDDLAADFACVATLGTAGCGFEQQLEAARKAVVDNARPGECNGGFLRSDSLLMILIVTDEDDCSVDPEHPEMFDTSLTDTLGHLGVRCYLNPEFVRPVSYFYDEVAALRPGRKEDIVVGLIVGVPVDRPACHGYGDGIAACLDAPEMIERFAPGGEDLLEPSCRTSLGTAYPPVRLVRFAQMWGRGAYVGSICQEDWSAPIGMIGARMIERLAPDWICLSSAIPYDYAGCRTPCRLVMTLPETGPCAEDPDCPSAGCPPVTSTDVLTAPPCTHPTTGASCVPRERDFGTIDVAGITRRLCVLRQAERTIGADGRCGSPTVSGWTYTIPSIAPHACHELDLRDSDTGRSMIRGSSALWCPR
jgi:hypothetical protein